MYQIRLGYILYAKGKIENASDTVKHHCLEYKVLWNCSAKE